MKLIQVSASDGSESIGMSIAGTVNACRLSDERCNLLLTSENASTNNPVEKLFGILTGFQKIEKKERWELKDGHEPVESHHFSLIERSVLNPCAPEKMLAACAKNLITSPKDRAKLFEDIHDVFQLTLNEGVHFSESSCELLIVGNKEDAKKAIEALEAMFEAFAHQSEFSLSISLITDEIDPEFHFYRISKREKGN